MLRYRPDAWTFDLQSFYAKAAWWQAAGLYTRPTSQRHLRLSIRDYSADITAALEKYGLDAALDCFCIPVCRIRIRNGI